MVIPGFRWLITILLVGCLFSTAGCSAIDSPNNSNPDPTPTAETVTETKTETTTYTKSATPTPEPTSTGPTQRQKYLVFLEEDYIPTLVKQGNTISDYSIDAENDTVTLTYVFNKSDPADQDADLLQIFGFGIGLYHEDVRDPTYAPDRVNFRAIDAESGELYRTTYATKDDALAFANDELDYFDWWVEYMNTREFGPAAPDELRNSTTATPTP